MDGYYLAFGTRDSKILIYHTHLKKVLQSVELASFAITGILIDPASQWVLAASPDGSLKRIPISPHTTSYSWLTLFYYLGPLLVLFLIILVQSYHLQFPWP